MNFIRKWSFGCANSLAHKLGESHQKRGVYYYGFQIVIGAIVKGTAITAVTLILDTFVQTMVVLAFFTALRVLAGGYHLSSYNKCVVASITLFTAAGAITRYTYAYWKDEVVMVMIIVSFFIGLAALMKWAPRENPNRPITKREEIKRFKYLSFIVFISSILASGVLLYFNCKQMALSGLFGTLLSIFIITPMGYRFFSWISGENKMAENPS